MDLNLAPTPRFASHRAVLMLAVPIMVSNISTPLIGMVDTTVVGRLPGAEHVGAVALGSLVFSFVFWAFGFLRMGTTGLCAQALGAGDHDEIRASLGRSLLIAAIVGVVLMFLGAPVRYLSLEWIQGSVGVERLAGDYIETRILGAPASLANYALLGWFIGLGKTRTGLLLQLVLNLSNIALDTAFVLILNMGVHGVALGSVIAEWLAVIVGLIVAWRYLKKLPGRWSWSQVVERERVLRTFVVSRDIMLRSIALVVVFLFFMSEGASMGDRLLAVNAVLMHFVDLSAYFLDGLAFAAETLVGRAVGAKDREAFWSAARRTTLWAGIIALFQSALLILCGGLLIDLLTSDPGTRLEARDYMLWAAAAPLVGVWCYQLDGIFVGATRTGEMRNAMLVSTSIFFLCWWLLRPFENHGLWLAFHLFLVARLLTLGAYLIRLWPKGTDFNESGRSAST